MEQKSGTMQTGISQAYVVHRTASRMRLRIPGRRLDQAYFERLKQRLIRSLGVMAVEINPLTASVLIEHSSNFKLASFGALGIALAIGEPGAGGGQRHGVSHRAQSQRDEGTDLLWAAAKLAYAAMTGRLWRHVLDLIVGWCAQALIDALLHPTKASAQVIRLARPPRPRPQQALAAAA